MQKNFKISFIFSSHDSGLIKAADDLIVLRDGVIQSIRRKPEPGQVAPSAALPIEDDDAPADDQWGKGGPETDFSFLNEETRPFGP
jgi:hypothetical protein